MRMLHAVRIEVFQFFIEPWVLLEVVSDVHDRLWLLPVLGERMREVQFELRIDTSRTSSA
jgi:hypothetical protein